MSRRERTFDLLNRASVARTQFNERQIVAMFEDIPKQKKLPKANMTLQQMDTALKEYRFRFTRKVAGKWLDVGGGVGVNGNLSTALEAAYQMLDMNPAVHYRVACFCNDEMVFALERHIPKERRL